MARCPDRLQSIRQLARIGKDDLRLALISTDLPGDADLHVDRLLTLLGKVTALETIGVGLVNGGRAPARRAYIYAIGRGGSAPREIFSAMTTPRRLLALSAYV